MFVSKAIPAEHKDLIHDVSYDFHGQRMATCSSDQVVKVYFIIAHKYFLYFDKRIDGSNVTT